MPGGAPLRRSTKRPCKYGPRDAAGLCPKKPRASRTARAKVSAKPPCKYGPRDASGHCPKKPKVARRDKAPSVRDYSTVNRAAQQAGEVLRSKKATRDQKKEAVKVLGSAVAEEAAKKVAGNIYREAKKAVRQPATKKALVEVAKKVGIPLAKATGVAAAIAGTLAVGGAALTSQREKEAARWADQQLRATRKKVTLTNDQARTLWHQYYDHALKKPVTNPFTGK